MNLLLDECKMESNNYILFTSEKDIIIEAFPQWWRGIIEYSYDNKDWYVWHGDRIINNTIYMRGVNNTVVSNHFPWTITGENVRCKGNIENLLNYKLVRQGIHPKMDIWCFGFMFAGCTALIEAPELPAQKLTDYCYTNMFAYCTSLQVVHDLSATKLATSCYNQMFFNCKSLLTSPKFPNEVLMYQIADNEMFTGCNSLKHINVNNKLYDANILRLC